jgi:phospholipase C
VLDAIWGNPALWDSTVVFLDYDENDGFFDHIPPPVPPPGTPGEFLPANQPVFGGVPPPSGPPTPIGLGPRVPMTVISPWSRGGWVNSQVFDHTSVLRFLEKWTGVAEPNISQWRRSVCGDLLSCFDFSTSKTTIPHLPDTAQLRLQADRKDPGLPAPSTPPKGKQLVPTQAPGDAPARPIPYQPLLNFAVIGLDLQVRLTNHGKATFPVSIHPHTTTGLLNVVNLDVAPAATKRSSVAVTPVTGTYDVWVHGPNGFLGHAAGDSQSTRLAVEANLLITGTASRPSLLLTLTNSGASAVNASVTSRSGVVHRLRIGSRHSGQLHFDPIPDAHGWYDLSVTLEQDATFARRYAGHLENGKPSRTG